MNPILGTIELMGFAGVIAVAVAIPLALLLATIEALRRQSRDKDIYFR